MHWTDQIDQLGLVVPDMGLTTPSMYISATYTSEADTGTTSHSATAELVVDITPGFTSQTTGYIITKGSTYDLIRNCDGSGESVRPVEVPVADVLPHGWARFERSDKQLSHAFRIGNRLICANLQLWSSKDAQHTISIPSLYGMADRGPSTPVNPVTEGVCVGAGVNFQGGVTVDYQYPLAETSSANNFPTSLDWSSCQRPEDKGAANTGRASHDYLATHGPISMRLTDTEQDARVSHNLFFAGAFAGVLGALAIEMLNAVFDVGEAGAKRRKVKRNGQPSRLGRLWRRLRRKPPVEPSHDEQPRWEPDSRSYL